MLKKLNVFALALLIIGQTILGPMSVAVADAGTSTSLAGEQVEEVTEILANDYTEEVDKTILEKYLTEYEAEGYVEKSYTTETFDLYKKAIEEGKVVELSNESTQEDVDNAVHTIKKAIEGLEVEEATEVAEAIIEKETEESLDATIQTLEEEDAVEEVDKEDASTSNYLEELLLTDEEHIQEFVFKVNGETFVEGETNVSNGDQFELRIDFNEISNELNYGPGTKLKYELPDSFFDNFSNLQIPGTFGGVGTIEIDGGFVVITLHEGVLINETVSNINDAYFTIYGIFSDGNKDWEKEIELPGGETFKVNFVPKSNHGKTIEKENGTANKNGQKSDKIDWKVTVNTNLANTSDQPLFTDKLSANATGHKYDPASVKVYEIAVYPDGTEVVSDTEAPGITPEFSEDDTEMSIKLEKGKAYQIIYTTIPENPGVNEDVIFANEASYDGNSDKGYASVHYGKAIDKEVSGPNPENLTANWKIIYNGNEQVIPTGTKITDGWKTTGTEQTGKQVLVNNAGEKAPENAKEYIKITRPDGGKIPDYTVTYNEAEEKFELILNEEINYPIYIEYQTKPEGFIASENFQVTNKAEHGHIDKSVEKTVEYNQRNLTLRKDAIGSLNYKDKTMEWKITANQAGYDLIAGDTFIDEFLTENMILLVDSLEVVIGGKTATKDVEYELINKDTDGFEIKLLQATSEQIVITYKTSFEQIKNVEEERSKEYKNKVTLKTENLPTDPTDDAEHRSNNEQKANGSKKGHYNYETKEFIWEILFNYNSNTLNDAVFKDALPEEHAITEFTLEKGSIAANGSFVTEEAVAFDESILGSNTFTLNLGKIDQPYRVSYKTKMKDGVLPVDGENNYSVKNKAELLDGETPNAKWESTVTVENTEKVLDQKNGSQIWGTNGIKWNFLYNTAQSELENVEIRDTFGLDNGMVNQLIDEKSVKVYKATYTGTNPNLNKMGQLLEEGKDYTLAFNQDGATFILTFDKLDHAIYVEYESTFIGLKDSPISNELTVSFHDGEDSNDSNKVSNLHFEYGSHAATRSGEFVIRKTDAANGKPLEAVEFTLKDRSGRPLLTGKTDENGILDFGMPLATGVYQLEEVPQEGYEPLQKFTFTLKATGAIIDGKQIVNVTNTPVGEKLCPIFTITVKDVENQPAANKTIKLVNKKTGEIHEVETNQDGQIVKNREDLLAGEYVVYEVVEDEEIYINEITVNYIGEDDTECNAEVRPEVTSIKGLKIWKDGDVTTDRPESITINLFADNVKVNQQNVTANENWEYSFENLRKYDNNGEKEIEYSIEEEAVDGYKTSYNVFDVINTRYGEPIEITVTKTWKDDNAVENRPQAITINLLQNGKVIETEELTASTNWKHTFTGLVQYDEDGVAYEYTVNEQDVAGYASSIDGFDITNTRTAKKDITILKSWLDNENATNSRPSEITVNLHRFVEGGERQLVDTYTVNAENDWQLVIEDLDSFDENGKAYTYEIVEEAVEGYESMINGFNITNLRVGTTEVTGTKTWVDTESNKNRPESITVRLYANGVEVDVQEVSPNADDEWLYSFVNLPRFDEEGKEIAYSVTEDAVEGYASSIDENFNITNTRTAKKEITILKSWVDNNDATESRPDEINVNLYRYVKDGEKQYVDTYTVKAEDNWQLTIKDLDSYDQQAEEYTYEIVEEAVEGYESMINGFNITNLRVGTTEVTGTKTWVDTESNKNRPESITVRLYANGVEVDVQDVSPNADDEWLYSFVNLPRFDEEGKEIAYSVTEDAVEGYNTSIDENFNITNTRKTYAIGDYVWVDRNNDGKQDENEEPLAGVIVELYDAEGNKISETLTDENGKYIFDELVAGDYQVKFTLTKEQAKKYQFTKQYGVEDPTLDSDADETTGWTAIIKLDDENEYVTKDYENQPFFATEGIDPTWDAGVIELIIINGTKVWEDNQYENRPDEIVVGLYADGVKVSEITVTKEDAIDENTWAYSFENLRKYNSDGTAEIQYTIIEETVFDNYITTIDGYEITNTKACPTFTLTIEDADGKPVKEGTKIKLVNKDTGEVFDTETNKEGKVVKERDELPVGNYEAFDEEGNLLGSFEVKYIGKDDKLCNAILKLAPEQSNDEDPEEADEKPNKKPGTKLPQTGEERFLYMMALGLFLAGAGVFVLFRQRRKTA